METKTLLQCMQGTLLFSTDAAESKGSYAVCRPRMLFVHPVMAFEACEGDFGREEKEQQKRNVKEGYD